jgi:RND superfamily putative drug exporter
LTAIARWSARRPARAIAAWLAFVAIALGALALTGGTKSLENGAVGESARGYAMLNAHEVGSPPREYVYLHSDRLRVGDPGFRAAIADVSRRLRAALGSRPTIQLSTDHRAALLTGVISSPPALESVGASVLAAATAHPGVTIEQPSEGSAREARDRTVNRDLHRAELYSIPLTLLVLLLAFGAGVAALVPVLLGLTAVAAAFGLLGPVSQAFPLDGSVKTVVLLIGLAVGVDYALFYVIRSREERRGGLSSHEALERTARTSGRTVLISGSTVVVAMAGMYVVGSSVLNGVASGTIAVVACAVVGSVTVLPAVLELLGARIERGRIPLVGRVRRPSSDQSRFWSAVIDRVLRRPLLSALLSASLLLALAVPALGLHVSKPSDEALASQSDPAIATLARVRVQFPSTAAPAIVVATAPAQERQATAQAAARLQMLVAARAIAHPPFSIASSRDGRALSIEFPLTAAGNNDASRAAIATLRDQLIPQTLGRVPGAQSAVTGAAAEDVDFTHQMQQGTPYVIAFVLGLAFLLLLVTFRSIVVPVKAIVLNLMSVGAAYGVLALVFQRHWAQGLLGFHSDGAVVAWLPLFLFVVLFGLSMDYHVFILSRVREAVDDGMEPDAAVRYGIVRTAGVVTSAALVMVGVFSLFASLSSLDLKQAGVGLAAAVLIDATLVRAVLLPASMKLLGRWNWYLPSWLGWLPGVERSNRDNVPSSVPLPARG